MNKRPPVEAIVFDVEGTLIDCVRQTLDCWQKVLRQSGHPQRRADLQQYSGYDGAEMLERLLPLVPASKRKSILVQHGKIYQQQYLDRAQPFSGVHELFARLIKRGYRLGLATTCKRNELKRYDKLLDVLRYCEAVACGSDVKHGKPHPDLFQAVLHKLRVEACVTIAVGDSPYDAEAARCCGMRPIGVLTGGFQARHLYDAGCEHVSEAVTAIRWPASKAHHQLRIREVQP